MKEIMYRQDIPPVHQRLQSLPVQNGYPVPWFVAKVDGQPYDFRCIDPSKKIIAVKKNLCWVCGQKLGAYLAFGVGCSVSAVSRTTSEPPAHRECMEWSIKACPFLALRQQGRRNTNLPDGIQAPPGIADLRQPQVMGLWVTKSYEPFSAPNDGGILFKMGNPTEVVWFKEGRLATREECIESLGAGYPFLLELATIDGMSAIRALEKRTQETMKLLPAKE